MPHVKQTLPLLCLHDHIGDSTAGHKLSLFAVEEVGHDIIGTQLGQLFG